jgi:hypothetical protein
MRNLVVYFELLGKQICLIHALNLGNRYHFVAFLLLIFYLLYPLAFHVEVVQRACFERDHKLLLSFV